MPHAKTLEKEANVQRVLEVALDSFYNHGIDKTKIADIAENAGVTSMSVHRYFGDKCTLVLRTGEIFWDKFTAKVAKEYGSLKDHGATGREQVADLLERARIMYLQHPRLVIWMQDYESYIRGQLDSGKLTEADISDFHYEESTLMLEALKAGAADGSVRSDIAPEDLYHTIMALVFGVAYRLSTCVGSFYADSSSRPATQLQLCKDMIMTYIST